MPYHGQPLHGMPCHTIPCKTDKHKLRVNNFKEQLKITSLNVLQHTGTLGMFTICFPPSLFSLPTIPLLLSLGTADNKYLQQLDVPFISQETCSQRSWYGTAMRDYMICAGYEQGRKDTCQVSGGHIAPW